MRKFKEINRKKRTIFIGGISVVLLITIVLLYRSYAIYQENQSFNVIHGSVPNQNYDVMISYYMSDENGHNTFVSEIPNGRDYEVSIVCNNDANATWNYDTWQIEINSLKTRTK